MSANPVKCWPKGGMILWHIWSRGTQNPRNGAVATFINGSGWFLVWWFLFSSTTPKSGNFSVLSAASATAAAVTVKIKKNTIKNMWYINSRVFNSGDFNNDLHFHFWVPLTPARAPPGGGLGAKGVIPPKNMWYINSRVLNSGVFKNGLHFHFRLPPTPARAHLGGEQGV